MWLIAAEESGPNIYSVWVQLLVFLGLLVTALLSAYTLRRGQARRSSDESETADSSTPSTQATPGPPAPGSEPALIMLINQNEQRGKELQRDLNKARAQRERDLTEIATLKAEVEDLREENTRLRSELSMAHTTADAALRKATQLADRLEYLERLIKPKEPT